MANITWGIRTDMVNGEPFESLSGVGVLAWKNR